MTAPVHDCLFCRLAAEPAPHEFYRDEAIYAILVLKPIRPGHALILPREHYAYFDDMPDDLAARVMAFGQRLARVQKARFGVERAGFLYTGGDIAHAHAHVVPLHEKTDITSPSFGFRMVRDERQRARVPSARDLHGMAHALRTDLG